VHLEDHRAARCPRTPAARRRARRPRRPRLHRPGPGPDDAVIITGYNATATRKTTSRPALGQALSAARARVELRGRVDVVNSVLRDEDVRDRDVAARRAARGLITCGPAEDWLPFLAAADVAVIDHSSLSLYYALLGRRPRAITA
jgi:hypothetical protein